MSFWYIATPYSNYPGGREAAYEAAVEATGYLTEKGLRVFSPIVHSHPQTKFIGLKTHQFWLNLDRTFMEISLGMIVVKLPNWESSAGINEEISWFSNANKPIHYLRNLTATAIKDLVNSIQYGEV